MLVIMLKKCAPSDRSCIWGTTTKVVLGSLPGVQDRICQCDSITTVQEIATKLYRCVHGFPLARKTRHLLFVAIISR